MGLALSGPGALRAAGALDRGARVAGLPPCVDREASVASLEASRRTTNRFYVDAEHQLDRALSFFPDLVRFAKPDSCRFCRADSSCDGVAAAWLEAGLAGPLEPL